MGSLMRTLKDRHQGLPNQGTSRGCPRGGGEVGGGILADFVAHLSGNITQGLWYRLALPKTLDTAVQEPDPPQQQVRAVAQRHDDNGDGGR